MGNVSDSMHQQQLKPCSPEMGVAKRSVVLLADL